MVGVHLCQWDCEVSLCFWLDWAKVPGSNLSSGMSEQWSLCGPWNLQLLSWRHWWRLPSSCFTIYWLKWLSLITKKKISWTMPDFLDD
ncbi:hypothetical protein Y1Q_0019193 [Alligator mississippiensis]|uniref:Uncharacterized protein n=1 Tax=Alligator mississippiensis TaxID=8496 RepID=A0A151MQB0_ALLMI|nr:hypothetical protein Y1Q_0019193 [Alligator mississippiensis]